MTELNLSTFSDTLATFTGQGRTMLIPALQAAQQHFGYIPEPVAIEIGHSLHVPLSEIYGVIDFYTLLYRHPVGKTVIHVCNDPACAMSGSESVLKMVTQRAEVDQIFSQEKKIVIERAPCLGLCEHAPALLVQGKPYAWENLKTWDELVAGISRRPKPLVTSEVNNLTLNCGKGNATSLEMYRSSGGYQGLVKALQSTPEKVIEEVKTAGLVGRGGAAFPTGMKWESAVKVEVYPRYIVCNADEAEPGTFKDRILMEDDPHRVLEGILIAGYAIGALKGYIFIRGEYDTASGIIQHAIEEARHAGLMGKNILGSSFSFELEIRRGAGAYVCGEETALFESIEGKRGFPRLKPPFPTTNGLFGKPTVINNVETLANVPTIISHGAEQYRKMGTEKSPGSKLFCLSGDVVRPGLYEVPFGVTFDHLLNDLAGGVRNGGRMQAALFGGAAGAFATMANLNVRLTFEDLRAAGLPLGSGVITVMDETRDLRDTLLRLAKFFADESCGKCYPCQLGTQRQLEIIERLVNGKQFATDVDTLKDIAATMTDASICGLGQTAASAVLSAVNLWPDMFSPAGTRKEPLND